MEGRGGHGGTEGPNGDVEGQRRGGVEGERHGGEGRGGFATWRDDDVEGRGVSCARQRILKWGEIATKIRGYCIVIVGEQGLPPTVTLQ